MTISAGIKTPGIYTDVNINTQRSGLLSNTQKVLFITTDNAAASTVPINIYDTASADTKFGKNSIAGRMMKAAIKTFRTVDVQGYATGAGSTDNSNSGTGSDDYTPSPNGSGAGGDWV